MSLYIYFLNYMRVQIDSHLFSIYVGTKYVSERRLILIFINSKECKKRWRFTDNIKRFLIDAADNTRE
jgi:hypothetical protein